MLTVIIPNFNGKDLLQNYLPSIFSSLKYAKIDYEFIVVDDLSTDDSVKFLNEFYPKITVIQNNKNLGFSKSCNKAIQLAKGTYTLLLNSDIKLTDEYIKKCLDSFQQLDNNAFAMTGMALDASKTPQTTGVFFKQGLFTINKYPNVNTNETHFVSGANSIYNTKKLQELNGFNEIFSPFYFEDDDLSFRAFKKGWKSYFINEAICYHLGASTIKSCSQKRDIKKIYFRNKIIFNRLHSRSSNLSFDAKNIILNIVPKYCVGNFWIWDSYIDYRKIILKP